ncbi:MAG: LptF/LptG family permease [Bacteroidales bacterium]|nr:LptF/LptG family permease [Bacteroidales bacterium]MBQ7818202.1 LptF/LptG family permease [Bacteroidales bacterium]
MLKIKRLYLFILKTFLPLVLMTFMICLFIVLMQFIWQHIKDFVGKGLEIGVLAEMFFYAAMSMVPLALPLAILLASLMTFGNLSERFELLAIKASGVSLIKIMRPLIVTIIFIATGAFFFQNNLLPTIQVKMWTLLYSMKQKSPALEIPEGVFYNQIEGYNIFVREKDNKKNMMYDIIIYDISKGAENAMIILADSGNLKFTDDNHFLFLTLESGESFENLKSQEASSTIVPYRRETFSRKEILIPFDAGFNRLDESAMSDKYVGKNIAELKQAVDSMTSIVDSIGTSIGNELKTASYYNILERATSSSQPSSQTISLIDFDIENAYSTASVQERENWTNRALNKARTIKQEYEFKSYRANEQKNLIRRHEIEMHKKFTLSFACLIFFFIGAPLGAIIGRGGLGTPIVVSVILFIFYYIIDNSAYKMARDGVWEVWQGLWLSSAVLLPLGIFFTYKAVNDSAVFNKDAYANFFRKLFGRHSARKVEMKEVAMIEVHEDELIEKVDILDKLCEKIQNDCGNKHQSFITYWQKGYNKAMLDELRDNLEDFVEYAQYSKSRLVVLKLMDYPILRNLLLYYPCKSKGLGTIIALILPISIPVYLIGIYEQKLLRREFALIRKTNKDVKTLVEKEYKKNV